jgi:hypothetical protein
MDKKFPSIESLYFCPRVKAKSRRTRENEASRRFAAAGGWVFQIPFLRFVYKIRQNDFKGLLLFFIGSRGANSGDFARFCLKIEVRKFKNPLVGNFV